MSGCLPALSQRQSVILPFPMPSDHSLFNLLVRNLTLSLNPTLSCSPLHHLPGSHQPWRLLAPSSYPVPPLPFLPRLSLRLPLFLLLGPGNTQLPSWYYCAQAPFSSATQVIVLKSDSDSVTLFGTSTGSLLPDSFVKKLLCDIQDLSPAGFSLSFQPLPHKVFRLGQTSRPCGVPGPHAYVFPPFS